MVSAYSVERVGIDMGFNAIAVQNASGDTNAFVKAVEAARSKSDLPFILMSDSAAALEAALGVEGGHKPLLYAATADNWEDVVAVAKTGKASVAIRSTDGLGQLCEDEIWD